MPITFVYRPFVLDILSNQNTIYAGVNRDSATIEEGSNDHLRIIPLKSRANRKPDTSSHNIFKSTDPNEYQKCTTVGANYLAISSSAKQTGLRVLNLDGLAQLYAKPHVFVHDVAFSLDGEILAFSTKEELHILDAPTGKELVRVAAPHTDQSFSKIRFTEDDIICLLHQVPPASRSKKAVHLAKYTMEGKLKAVRRVPKLVSASAMDSGRDYTVLAGSDLSLTVVSNRNLHVLFRLRDVHGFSITSISINRSQTKVASTSVANTVHVLEIPKDGVFYRGTRSLIWALLSIVLIFVLMIIEFYFGLHQMSSDFFHSRMSELKGLIETDHVTEKVADMTEKLAEITENVDPIIEITGLVQTKGITAVGESIETAISEHLDL